MASTVRLGLSRVLEALGCEPQDAQHRREAASAAKRGGKANAKTSEDSTTTELDLPDVANGGVMGPGKRARVPLPAREPAQPSRPGSESPRTPSPSAALPQALNRRASPQTIGGVRTRAQRKIIARPKSPEVEKPPAAIHADVDVVRAAAAAEAALAAAAEVTVAAAAEATASGENGPEVSSLQTNANIPIKTCMEPASVAASTAASTATSLATPTATPTATSTAASPASSPASSNFSSFETYPVKVRGAVGAIKGPSRADPLGVAPLRRRRRSRLQAPQIALSVTQVNAETVVEATSGEAPPPSHQTITPSSCYDSDLSETGPWVRLSKSRTATASAATASAAELAHIDHRGPPMDEPISCKKVSLVGRRLSEQIKRYRARVTSPEALPTRPNTNLEKQNSHAHSAMNKTLTPRMQALRTESPQVQTARESPVTMTATRETLQPQKTGAAGPAGPGSRPNSFRSPERVLLEQEASKTAQHIATLLHARPPPGISEAYRMVPDYLTPESRRYMETLRFARRGGNVEGADSDRAEAVGIERPGSDEGSGRGGDFGARLDIKYEKASEIEMSSRSPQRLSDNKGVSACRRVSLQDLKSEFPNQALFSEMSAVQSQLQAELIRLDRALLEESNECKLLTESHWSLVIQRLMRVSAEDANGSQVGSRCSSGSRGRPEAVKMSKVVGSKAEPFKGEKAVNHGLSFSPVAHLTDEAAFSADGIPSPHSTPSSTSQAATPTSLKPVSTAASSPSLTLGGASASPLLTARWLEELALVSHHTPEGVFLDGRSRPKRMKVEP